MHSNSPRTRSPQAPRVFRLLLRRVLVLLMIWQSAAPFCHAHADPQLPPHALSAGERVRLVLHVQTCHDSQSPAPQHSEDWHTHFGRSAEAITAAGVECEARPDFWWSRFDVPSPTLLRHCLSALAWPVTTDAACSPASFHSSFAHGLALPLRFCVARC